MDLIPLDKMSDSVIGEILRRRMGDYSDILPEETKQIVIDYADGNPREALTICLMTLVRKSYPPSPRLKDFVISPDELLAQISRLIVPYAQKYKISSRERELLKAISHKKTVDMAEIKSIVLSKTHIPEQTVYTSVKSLIKKNILLRIKADKLMIDSRYRIFSNYFL